MELDVAALAEGDAVVGIVDELGVRGAWLYVVDGERGCFEWPSAVSAGVAVAFKKVVAEFSPGCGFMLRFHRSCREVEPDGSELKLYEVVTAKESPAVVLGVKS